MTHHGKVAAGMAAYGLKFVSAERGLKY